MFGMAFGGLFIFGVVILGAIVGLFNPVFALVAFFWKAKKKSWYYVPVAAIYLAIMVAGLTILSAYQTFPYFKLDNVWVGGGYALVGLAITKVVRAFTARQYGQAKVDQIDAQIINGN